MLLGYNSKNFISNLNNIFLFYNLRKTKKIKNWFLYLYWTYLLHELSKYTKLYYILNKKKRWKKYYINQKYNLYKKFIKFNLELKKFKLKKYYKYKILLLKTTISYFFDFLIKFIKNKKINEDKFFLLKKLSFWKVNKHYKFFTGFNYYKLFLKKKKKMKRTKLSSIYEENNKHESKILNIKLDLFSLSTYNLKWHTIMFICNLYKPYYSLNTLMDVMNLLDRKVDYLLMNWFNISSNDINLFIREQTIRLNSSYLIDTNYIIENGFILTVNNNLFNSNWNVLLLEKRIFDIFLFLNENYNKFFNYINWFTYIKIKKYYLLSISKIKFSKSLYESNNFLKLDKNNIVKYVQYFYNIINDYASILKKNMDLILHKKGLKSKKFSQIKRNFFITIYNFNIKTIAQFDLLSNTTKSYSKTINDVLNITAFYYILKKKISKLRALKKNNILDILLAINFKKELLRYFINGKLNILFFYNLNNLLKNIIHVNYQYLLYFVRNNLIKNLNLNSHKLHIKFNFYKTDTINFTNKIFKFDKKKSELTKYKLKKKLIKKYSYFKTNSKALFITNNIKKDYIQFYRYKVINSLLFNYIHNNNIISYKSKILFYDLETNTSFINMKSKWLRLFDLNEKVNFNNLKKNKFN